MKRSSIHYALSAIALLAGAQAAQAQGFTFQTFRNPGAGYTQARGFGPKKSAVGYDLSGSNLSASGFQTSSTGQVTTINSPTGGSSEVFNYAGGLYLGQSHSFRGAGQGFTRDQTGTYTTIAVPLSANTAPLAMNTSGIMVGSFTPSSGAAYQQAGFTLQNGVYTVFTVPGADIIALTGINNKGIMVGNYTISGQPPVGFVLTNGVMTNIACPNANSTYVSGINNTGLIVGYCQVGSFSAGFTGFVYDGTTFTMFSEPGATSTYAWNINDAGAVVGYGLDSSGSSGYVAKPIVAVAK